MTQTSLQDKRTFTSGAALGEQNRLQMLDGTDLKKFHLSVTPALREAMRAEAELNGMTQTDLIREAILVWIADRIDARETTVRS